MSILERIIDYKRNQEVPIRLASVSLEDMRQRALEAKPPLDFISALLRSEQHALGAIPPGKVALIAEIKKASPSKGLLCPDFDPLRLAEAYHTGGAAALSVLTDELFFQGSLIHLSSIRQRFPSLPLLRKDFIIHPYQVYEARASGADALLLIVAALEDSALAELMWLTDSLGMAALIEVHDEAELERALRTNPRLIGVNNRSLHDFHVDLNTCLSLRPKTPENICFVAESGIHTRADVEKLAQARVNAMLVGEALVTAPDMQGKIQELLR